MGDAFRFATGPRCHPFGAQPVPGFVPAWHRYRGVALMPRWYRPLFARKSDPIEYDGERRRPFWEVMECRAALGDADAVHILADRTAWLAQMRRLAEKWGQLGPDAPESSP